MQAYCRALDPAPLFVQGAAQYSYIQYGVFVALDILEVLNMGIIRIFRLYRECFDLAGAQRLISCTNNLYEALCAIVPP